MVTEAPPSLPPSPPSTRSSSRLRGRARALALEIAAEARAEWSYTSDVIGRAFRTNRQLGSGERRGIAETVYGLVRWHRRLQAIVDDLVKGGRQREPLPPAALDELLLLAYEARQGGDPAPIAEEASKLLRAPVSPERLAGEEAGLGSTSDLDREALRRRFPTWLLERFASDLGQAEALALADALNRRAPLAVRVNTGKIERAGAGRAAARARGSRPARRRCPRWG